MSKTQIFKVGDRVTVDRKSNSLIEKYWTDPKVGLVVVQLHSYVPNAVFVKQVTDTTGDYGLWLKMANVRPVPPDIEEMSDDD